jgi:hypothetical protein
MPWRRITRWRGVVSFTPPSLYPRGKNPRYPLDRRLSGPRAGLDNMEKCKSLILRNSNSDPSLVQPVASGYADCAIPALPVPSSWIYCLSLSWKKFTVFQTSVHVNMSAAGGSVFAPYWLKMSKRFSSSDTDAASRYCKSSLLRHRGHFGIVSALWTMLLAPVLTTGILNLNPTLGTHVMPAFLLFLCFLVCRGFENDPTPSPTGFQTVADLKFQK